MSNIWGVVTGPVGQTIGFVVLYMVLIFVVGKKSQIDSWCLANPRWAGIIKSVRSLFPDPLLLLQGMTLIVLRRMPTAYQILKNLEALEVDRKTIPAIREPGVSPPEDTAGQK
jgi:hypothetical protein